MGDRNRRNPQDGDTLGSLPADPVTMARSLIVALGPGDAETLCHSGAVDAELPHMGVRHRYWRRVGALVSYYNGLGSDLLH